MRQKEIFAVNSPGSWMVAFMIQSDTVLCCGARIRKPNLCSFATKFTVTVLHWPLASQSSGCTMGVMIDLYYGTMHVACHPGTHHCATVPHCNALPHCHIATMPQCHITTVPPCHLLRQHLKTHSGEKCIMEQYTWRATPPNATRDKE